MPKTEAHKLKPEKKIGPVLNALESAYGRPVCEPSEPLAVLIRGILSQNTSDTNSDRAYKRLRGKFPTWPALAKASPASIVGAIRSGGLADQKAKAIRNVMQWLEKKDVWRVDFLRGLEPADAERELSAVKGVGIKTARLVLLFGFGWPVFVVDTHVHRVSRRLLLIHDRCSRGKAHGILDDLVPNDRTFSAHMNLIRHGRRCCHARSPDCERCPVRRWCVFVRERG